MNLSVLFKQISKVPDGGPSGITKWLMAVLSGYDHKKYWKRRSVVVNPQAKVNPLVKMYYLLYIKRVD